MSYSCHTIGFVYFNLSNCNKALNYLYRALKLKQELNDEKTIAFTYTLIGNVYEKQGRFSDALKINFQSFP
jgi:tetratricopeptide (TPR) repeat protein